MKHFLPQKLILDLHPITIDLIGAGGTGSQMLTALARINHALIQFGRKGLHVTVYDGDKVSESNIGRQLFSEADVDLNKAQVLVDRCNRFFGTQWEHSRYNYPMKKSFGANIIISCVDNTKTRHLIHEQFKTTKINKEEYIPYYFLDFGNSKHHGQIVLGTFNPIPQPNEDDCPFLPTIIDLFPNLSDNNDNTPSCSLAAALTEQDLFINTSLIPFGATILWNLLKNYFIIYSGAYVNLSEMKVIPISINHEK